ncbi:hypothetical protein [Williamsia herbipolensis]|uniref:hypothetical protein n=1 Tax=Williamsia herbipolensis TaxID=1603258 RepID=UPI0012378D6E|nr:hypothetical protein [Williamsia herbipolensis]
MSEKLKVEPAQLGGAGEYVLRLGDNARSAVELASAHTKADSGDFKGLMALLRGPVDSLASATQRRQRPVVDALVGTGNELKQNAWDYQSQDRSNAVSLGHTTFGGPTGMAVESFPGSESYGAPTPVDVAAPPHSDVDFRGLIDETMGFVGEVDGKIQSLIGWSPVQSALEPIAGNWAALRTIGQTYGKAGTALGTVGDGLSDVRGRLDPHWDGRAAVAFGDYATDLARGLEWEAATGRLVQQGLELAADKIEEAVKRVLVLLKDSLAKFVDFHDVSGTIHTVLKLIPGLGTKKTIEQVTLIIQDIYKTVDFMLTDVKRAVESVEEFLRFVEDPVGYVGDKSSSAVDEKLAPFKKNIDDARQSAQNTRDFLTVADVDSSRDMPHQRYEAGFGNDPWEDAP